MTFLMTGGGTGGHVIPAIAVAKELQRRGHYPFFVGTESGMESRIVPREGFEIEYVKIGGLNRVGVAQQLRTLAMLPGSIMTASSIIERRKPVGVFSMGGYAAAPAMIAARWKKLPVVLMEPNAMPGFVSRRMANHIDRALLSFEEEKKYFPQGCVEITGLPVRREFFEIPRKAPGSPLKVMITGASQGSKRLNETARDAWPLFEKAGWPVEFIHQTGRLTHGEFAPLFEQARIPGRVTEFIVDMPAAFAEVDLIVCRSGAGTVSELAAAGKPAILVPFPFSADDHQLKNAAAMQHAGAALLIRDQEMTGQRLFDEVMRFVNEPQRLMEMGEAARKLAKPGAAERAADLLEELAK